MMNLESFTKCFEELCNSFDLDFDKKKSRINSYFQTKLGELSEINMIELIRAARETLKVKTGFLPPVNGLLDLYYSSSIGEFKYDNSVNNKESFNQAFCALCGNTGYISLVKGGYQYGGFCCTCRKGEKRYYQTEIGRKLGFYTVWLERGFSMIDEEIPF